MDIKTKWKKKESDLFVCRIKGSAAMCVFLLTVGLLFPLGLFGYDFSDVRTSLIRDLKKWQGYASRNKIAVVYNVASRDQIKAKHNLIQFKKDLSHELLKSFDVADPIIVQEIINTNQLQFNQIADNKSILEQFSDRSGSVHVLMVDLKLKADNLLVSFDLKNRDNTKISTVTTEIAAGSQKENSYQPQHVVAQSSEPETPVYQSFNMDFSSRQFTAGQNDSWIYFSPTALVNPSMNALTAMLWFKDLQEVDIQVVKMRYSLKVVDVLQFGVQSYAIAEKVNSKADEPNLGNESGHHSTYLSVKFLIVDESVLPVNFAVGLRRRILWDEDNTDFRSRDEVNESTNSDEYDDAKDLDEQHDKYNQLTLQAMVTGKIEPIGILYNAYLDSLTFGAGVKFVLTPDIKLFADNIYNYYEDPDIDGDTAVGIQFYNPLGSADLVYQFETQQVQLGINLDF